MTLDSGNYGIFLGNSCIFLIINAGFISSTVGFHNSCKLASEENNEGCYRGLNNYLYYFGGSLF